MSSRAAKRRQNESENWVCRFCVHAVTKKPWFNKAGVTYCRQCSLHKSVCFKENLKQSGPPSTSNRSATLEAKCAELQEQVKQLQARRLPNDAGTGNPHPWADADAKQCDKRSRIKYLDGLIKQLANGGFAQDEELLKRYREEKANLETALFADRPVEEQARSLANRLQSARHKETQLQQARDERQSKIDELETALASLDSRLGEAKKEVLRLECETRATMSKAQPPDGKDEGPPSLRQMLPALSVSVEQLGAVASGLGVPPELLAELQAMATAIRKLGELPAAQPPKEEPQQRPQAEEDPAPNVDTMDVEDLRATLEAAGIPAQPTDDAEALRGKIRKMQTSYLTMCKRQKSSA